VKPNRLSERQQIDWLALLHEALTVEGSVTDIDNRFAIYSFGNRILLRVQGAKEPVKAGHTRQQGVLDHGAARLEDDR
jgi:hypothetical protein